jgi:hypothetical protein
MLDLRKGWRAFIGVGLKCTWIALIRPASELGMNTYVFRIGKAKGLFSASHNGLRLDELSDGWNG